MSKVWTIWKYTLGSFSDDKTSKYDNHVVILRSVIFCTYLATNCFIIAGIIRHWNDTPSLSITEAPKVSYYCNQH